MGIWGKEHALVSILEFDRQVELGEIIEPTYTYLRFDSGISCPGVNRDSGKVCGAHLRHMPGYVVGPYGEPRRSLGCTVCGRSWSRAVGIFTPRPRIR